MLRTASTALVLLLVVPSMVATPAHAQVRIEEAAVLNMRAIWLTNEGKLTQALSLAREVLATREKALPSGHPEIGVSHNTLAYVYLHLGQWADAETHFARALAIGEQYPSSSPVALATIRNNLGIAYMRLDRFPEALKAYQEALAIREQHLPPGHRDIGHSLNGIAVVQRRLGGLAEAERMYRRVIDVDAKGLAEDDPDRGRSYQNLAQLLKDQERHSEALDYFSRAIAIFQKAWPQGHPTTANTLNNIARLHVLTGNLEQAEQTFARVLTSMKEMLPEGHTYIIEAIGGLSDVHFRRKDWRRSLETIRLATSTLARQRYLTPGANTQPRSQVTKDYFIHHVRMARRVAYDDPKAEAALADEAFRMAQLSEQSGAAVALSQMAARLGGSATPLGHAVRARQDLQEEWTRADRELRSVFSSGSIEARRSAAKAIRARLDEIEARLEASEREIAAQYPSYALHALAQPLSLGEARSLLNANEALVLFMLDQGESFVWLVSKEAIVWRRLDVPLADIRTNIEALRCGLDAASWDAPADRDNDTPEHRKDNVGQRARAQACLSALGKAPVVDDKGHTILPFDAARAHRLYRALLGNVADLIRGKHLLLVPSGMLTTLPFQALVTEAPRGEDLSKVRWLVRDHALTVLPSVSSLTALRHATKPSAAPLAMIGFGNPLLDGDQWHPDHGAYYRDRAAMARRIEGCATTKAAQTASLRGLRRAVEAVPTVGGHASHSHLRIQAPLPETADELCAVARDLGADVGELRLGARATEAEVKALSARGELARYRIVHFATHGTLAGEISGTREPGLILTPPRVATDEDDGYLSVSEIAVLKLDADWVILSACNTAGGSGGEAGAEALSGLARVFFYAGARALLVSHWAVDSAATVKLVTGAVSSIAADGKVGRAEALRRAMLSLIDTGKANDTHPAYWAPFVVVGEGSADR